MKKKKHFKTELVLKGASHATYGRSGILFPGEQKLYELHLLPPLSTRSSGVSSFTSCCAPVSPAYRQTHRMSRYGIEMNLRRVGSRQHTVSHDLRAITSALSRSRPFQTVAVRHPVSSAITKTHPHTRPFGRFGGMEHFLPDPVPCRRVWETRQQTKALLL